MLFSCVEIKGIIENLKSNSCRFPRQACRCRMLRVHRHCPSDLFELVKGVAWRCFPGARDAVSKGIEDTVGAQGQPSSEGEDGERSVHPLGGEGSGDVDHGSTDRLPIANEGNKIKEEGPRTEEMSTTPPNAGNAAADGATVTTTDKDESNAATSVGTAPLKESSDDRLKIISKGSSEDVTEVPTALDGIDKGSIDESFESVPEDSSGAGVQDSTEGPVEASTGNTTTDTGNGEIEEEYDDEDSIDDLELEGSAGEESAVSFPAPRSAF